MAPENENPSTVPEPEETVKPALLDNSPPVALEISIPVISN